MVEKKQQAQIEAEIAKQLLAASDDERQELYGRAYDAIYEMHLSRVGISIEEQTFGAYPRLIGLLERLTSQGEEVLEVGCGAGMLAIELASRGRRVTGVDVSEVILARAREFARGRVELIHVTGISLPFDTDSFNFVYSVEVLEHLHERDAVAHLLEVRRVLRPGGRYWVMTPNRPFGIGAAERFGLDEAIDADVHLKEWTYAELVSAMRKAGFTDFKSPWRNGILHFLPLLPVQAKLASERLRNRWLAQLFGATNLSLVAR